MATAAQARLEIALRRVLDLDCGELPADRAVRRAGAPATQTNATLDALKAAIDELQAASRAAPDTPLPPQLLSALQRALAEGCGRGGDRRARLRRCFAAAMAVRGLLEGFKDHQACANQAGHRRQQVGGTRSALPLVWLSGSTTQRDNGTLWPFPAPTTWHGNRPNHPPTAPRTCTFTCTLAADRPNPWHATSPGRLPAQLAR
jgi:hypothetical protein